MRRRAKPVSSAIENWRQIVARHVALHSLERGEKPASKSLHDENESIGEMPAEKPNQWPFFLEKPKLNHASGREGEKLSKRGSEA